MFERTLTNESKESRSKRIDIVLWIVAWLLHLPKPVLTILNQSRCPLLGILYRFDNLSLLLNLLLLSSCLLMAINLYRGLARVRLEPFRQLLFLVFPIAIFILPIFSAVGAMLWLRGKKAAVAVRRKQSGVGLRAMGIFLVIIGWMFWVGTLPAFKGYVFRSAITVKVRAADQAVQTAASALKKQDLQLTRQEIERGKELLDEVASYGYSYLEEDMKRIEQEMLQVEQAAQKQEQKRLK